ncbi:hypothetical protein GIB67_036778, partial [Kingdonia uniflora]
SLSYLVNKFPKKYSCYTKDKFSQKYICCDTQKTSFHKNIAVEIHKRQVFTKI